MKYFEVFFQFLVVHGTTVYNEYISLYLYWLCRFSSWRNISSPIKRFRGMAISYRSNFEVIIIHLLGCCNSILLESVVFVGGSVTVVDRLKYDTPLEGFSMDAFLAKLIPENLISPSIITRFMYQLEVTNSCNRIF